MKLFDVHTHLQFLAFDEDRDEVILRTLENNIWINNVGSNSKNSAFAVELAEKYEGVFASVGIHPIHAGEPDNNVTEDTGKEMFDYELMKKIAEHKKTVAIGECGLDYFHLDAESVPFQKKVFESHIALAHEVKKPLMVHCRNAYEDLIDFIKQNKNNLNIENTGISHFFSGDLIQAKELLDLGFSFSFGGAITLPKKPNSCDFESIIKYLPKDKILLETDAPYVAPLKYRGRRNEPLYITETAKKMSEILNISYEEVANITTANALKIFNINLT